MRGVADAYGATAFQLETSLGALGTNFVPVADPQGIVASALAL